MGDTAPNDQPGPHVSGGVFLGYCFRLHQGNIGLETTSPDVPWEKYRLMLIQARHGSDQMLDQTGALVWGPWWQQEIVARGQRDAARLVLSLYLPLTAAIPP